MNAVPRRFLPGLNRTVSIIGAGCWSIGGPTVDNGVNVGWPPVDEHAAQRALRAAYEAGITVYDTADTYGRGLSEQRLGALVGDVPRDAITLISKVGYLTPDHRHPYHPGVMRHQLTATLARLGTDHLDVYAFHSGDFGPGDAYLDDAVATMNTFVEQGRVGAIGMRAPHEFTAESARQPETPQGRRAARFLTLYDRIKPQILTVRHNMLNPTYPPGATDLLAFADQAGVGVLCKQVLGQGLLTGTHDHRPPVTFGEGDHRSRKPWFTPAGVRIINEGCQALRDHFGSDPATLATLAIRYALQTASHAVALVGFRSAEQIRAAATSSQAPRLTDDEITLIRRTGQRIRRDLDNAFRPTP